MNIQEIVIYVALIIMIISLFVVFMMLYYSSDNKQFPPVIGKCPDFFVIGSDGNCKNFANVGNSGYDNIPPMSGVQTNDDLCNLKETLLTNRQTWDGITNNQKLKC